MAQVPTTQRSNGGHAVARREHPLERLQRDFDTLFGRLWGGFMTPFQQEAETLRVWDFDIQENDKEIVVRAELPGFEEKEIDVQLNKDVLTIKAEKVQKGEQEREYRSFYRSVTLPSGINPEKAQATYRNGVLELHVPRDEEARPKRIQVQGDQGATGQHQAMPKQVATSASQGGNPGQSGKQPAGPARK